MCLSYDTGESVYCQVYGTADDAMIRLEKSSINLENTSIGLISYKSVKLINRSDIMVKNIDNNFQAKFSWKDHFSETEERLFKSNQEIELYREEAKELDEFNSQTV